MKRLKIIGYAVVTRTGDVMHGSPGHEGVAMLWLGSHASLFPTRRVAQRLIDRTIKYAKDAQLDWPWVTTARIQALKAWQ